MRHSQVCDCDVVYDDDIIMVIVIFIVIFILVAAGVNRQTVTSVDLDYVEEQALLETQREIVGSLGTIPF